MKRWRWALILLPAGLGLVINLLLKLVVQENWIFYLRADLAIVVFVIGLLASILAGCYAYLSWRFKQNRLSLLSRARDDRLRMLRRLDHELKNPLTAIRAGLANLAEPAADDYRKDTLISVEAQTLRLSRLSANLRKLAELEDRLIERSPVDIPALLQEAFTMSQDLPGADERRLSLSVPRAPELLPKITGDPDLLLLAVHNLLENAVKFTRPGDAIDLCAFEDGAGIVIQVADTGPGIPEEEQPHVWEELYRGKGGRGIPGSGLGLSLVQAIMERHAGQASVRGQPGGGSVFILRFPVGRDYRVTNR